MKKDLAVIFGKIAEKAILIQADDSAFSFVRGATFTLVESGLLKKKKSDKFLYDIWECRCVVRGKPNKLIFRASV